MKKRYVIILTVAVVLVSIVTAFIVSPTPAARLMRRAFEKPRLAAPENHDELLTRVTMMSDIEYPSEFGENLLDIYLPRSHDGALPVIIWIHGGGYVGGGKSDAKYYAESLAAEGYAVVSMDYERAPEAKYPTPILQIAEVVAWIRGAAETYSLDTSRLIFAGDSAGAYSAAAFALIQTNPDYAAEIGIAPTISPEQLRGLLLYCGPYDVREIGQLGGVFGFLLKRAGWAYYGTKTWTSDFDAIGTIKNHITAEFPPSFITDGNTASFENHGRALAGALRELGVDVTEYFIPIETEKTMHEYQFVMNTPSGAECYELTLRFLRENVD